MANAPHRKDPFDPYIRIPGGLPDADQLENHRGALRAALMDRAVLQARAILHVVSRAELDILPPVLRGLDRETRGVMTHRVAAMLAAYERFLSDDQHADIRERLDPVFRPIATSVRGRYAVTSPALLVLHAILYSHCEWFRETLWEAHSAARAYSELLQSGYPEPDCRFIAAIIGHQTLVRTSWSRDLERDPLETYAWFGSDPGSPAMSASERFQAHLENRLEKMQEAAALIIGETLRDFLADSLSPTHAHQPGSRHHLSAALVLHALCLHARHQVGESIEDNIKIKTQALRFFDFLIENWDDDAERPRGLIFVQYGRYIDRNNSKLFKKLSKHMLGRLPDVDRVTNLTLCLHRVASRNVWLNQEFDEAWIRPLSTPDFPANIRSALRKTVGRAYSYEIPPAKTIRGLLGLKRKALKTRVIDEPDLAGLCAAFDAAEKKHLEYLRTLELPNRYFPAPLVGHILRSYRDIRPQGFAPLHVIGQEPRSLTSRRADDIQLTIWLPRKRLTPKDGSETVCHPDMVWQDQLDTAPDALIARYVAAIMLGVWVSFAPRRVLLDYVSDDIRDFWSKLIAAAFAHNGGPLMVDYSEQVRALRTVHDDSGAADPWSLQIGKEDRDRWHSCAADIPLQADKRLQVVGIDIGGTSIKAAVYEVTREHSLFEGAPPVNKDCRVQWSQVSGETRDERMRSLLGQALDGLGTDRKAIAALGISFAGPVADGVPVGVSGVLGNEKKDRKLGYTRQIFTGNPRELHAIDFAKAAKEMGVGSNTPDRMAAVAVLNDGDADIRASAPEFKPDQDHRIIVFKEGTGVAFALYEAGSPLDHPCETAKAVLNLRCRPSTPKAEDPKDPKDPKPFQKGELSGYASKKKFGALLHAAADGLKGLNPDLPADDILSKTLGEMLKRALDTPQPGPDRFVTANTQPQPEADGWTPATIIKGILAEMGYADAQAPSPPVEKAAATAATAITDLGHHLVDRFADSCRQCHEAASRVRRKRSWDQSNAISGSYVNGTGAVPAGFPACDKPRPWDDLNPVEQAAVGCAWVLGRWLADSIALTWELYGMREVRLAGGPLSGATGTYISQSARDALTKIYGFDLDRVDQTGPQGLDWYASARRREVKALRLEEPPPETSAEAGPLGAAMAAFDRHLAVLKLHQLRACRDAVPLTSSPFSVAKLVAEARTASRETHWIVADTEVAEMLERESMILGLTRERDGSFRRWN